jgi:hypothetical protein
MVLEKTFTFTSTGLKTFQNVGIYIQVCTAFTQWTNINIFSAAGTSNLIKLCIPRIIVSRMVPSVSEKQFNV